ncbi:SHOCT domain-containing protein [Sphingomonas sp. HMP6]|uniref:SHOCT domain-containing protein n=1 Tax=Sphingomonas sp. HMP6 TaxID=1517551 RepID=UPI0015966235|nr:SHOCT domain-containing protein [Sphingomonas sp. HMP6]BCA60227.1 hypothetical protein HMP06_2996 [Sphingomonas sp. HMP6]
MANISEELAQLAALRDQGVLSEAEFAAQKNALLQNSPATPIAPKKGNMLRNGGIGCAVILALLIVLAIIGSTMKPASPEKVTGYSAAPEAPVVSKFVTKAQFDQLRDGMSYAEAVKVLGGNEGEVMSTNKFGSTKTTMYVWKGTSFGGNMNAMFQNDRLMSKAQMGLE